MTKYKFQPNIEVCGKCSQSTFSIEELSNEVGVYSATPEFIRNNCGPIANMILDNIPQSYYDEAKELGLYPNCDVRIHRLYPGDYPAYPGWHCDGEYRETYFSQPDLNKIKVSKHIICTVSNDEAGITRPEFLMTPIECDIDENYDMQKTGDQHNLWGQVHNMVESIENRELKSFYDGDLLLFDARSLHRVMPARKRGWRLFFRMSMWHKPNLGDGGMISKQEQVYKTLEGTGW